MMDLQTAAAWAEVFGLVTILGAAIYSFYQIRELRRSRDSTTAMSLAANFQSEDFVVGLTSIINMKFDQSKFEYGDDERNYMLLQEHFGDDWPKVMTLLTTWESVGVLIHRGDMDFHVFYDLFSGVLLKTYEAFAFYLDPIRDDPTNKDLEWLIWLVDRVIEYEDSGSGTLAAWFEFKDWAPPLRR